MSARRVQRVVRDYRTPAERRSDRRWASVLLLVLAVYTLALVIGSEPLVPEGEWGCYGESSFPPPPGACK